MATALGIGYLHIKSVDIQLGYVQLMPSIILHEIIEKPKAEMNAAVVLALQTLLDFSIGRYSQLKIVNSFQPPSQDLRDFMKIFATKEFTSEEPLYRDICSKLDILIFHQEENEVSNRMAYLGRFAQPSLAEMTLDCYGRFQKFTLSTYKYAQSSYSLFTPNFLLGIKTDIIEMTSKKLAEPDVAERGIALMPEYFLRIRQLASGLKILTDKEYLELAAKCFENFIKLCNEFLLGDKLKRLTENNKVNQEKPSKALLLCYLYSHLPLASEFINQHSESREQPLSESLNEIFTQSANSLLKAIQTSFESSDKLTLESICMVFCNQLANLFTLEIASEVKIPEETADSIVALIANIYSQFPDAFDFRFSFSLANLLLRKTKTTLHTALIKQRSILTKLIEDTWFDEKIVEKESLSYFSPSLSSDKALIDYFCLFSEGFNGADSNTSNNSAIAKQQLSNFLNQVKKSISSMNSIQIDVIQEKRSILEAGIHTKCIRVQLQVFSHMLETLAPQLNPDQRLELQLQLMNLRDAEFGLYDVIEREIYNIIVSIMECPVQSIYLDRKAQILNSIVNMTEECLKVFLSQAELKMAKQEVIEEYGKLNVLAFGMMEDAPEEKLQEWKIITEETKEKHEAKLVVRKPILRLAVGSSLKESDRTYQKITLEILRRVIRNFSASDSLKAMKATILNMKKSIFCFLLTELLVFEELLEETIGKLDSKETNGKKDTLKFLFTLLKFMKTATHVSDTALALALETNILTKLPKAIKIVASVSKQEGDLPSKMSYQKFFTLCIQFYTQIKSNSLDKKHISIPQLEKYPLPKNTKLEGSKELLRVGRELFLNTDISPFNISTTKHFKKIDNELITLVDCLEEEVKPESEKKEFFMQPQTFSRFETLVSDKSSLSNGGIFQNLFNQPIGSTPTLNQGTQNSSPGIFGSAPLGTSSLGGGGSFSNLFNINQPNTSPIQNTSSPGLSGSGPSSFGGGLFGNLANVNSSNSTTTGSHSSQQTTTPSADHLLKIVKKAKMPLPKTADVEDYVRDLLDPAGTSKSTTSETQQEPPEKNSPNFAISTTAEGANPLSFEQKPIEAAAVVKVETITKDELSELQGKLRKAFFEDSYKGIIKQLIIIIGVTEECDSALLLLEKLFNKLSSDQGFQKYVISITEELNEALKMVFVENCEEKLKLQELPRVICSQNPYYNILLSLALSLKFLKIVSDTIPEEQTSFIPSAFQQEFISKQGNKLVFTIYNLSDKELQSAWKETCAFRILTLLSVYPTYSRYGLHVKLYNKGSFSEFTKEEHDKLDFIYEGIKFVLNNRYLFSENVIEMECRNLFSLMVWSRTYAERVIQEGLMMILISLQGAPKIKVIPHILDMLISEQIPVANRIEIALKGAFLRGGSILLMEKSNTLACLETLLRIYPESFKAKFHQILEVKRIDAGDKKQEEEKKESSNETQEELLTKISSEKYMITFKQGISNNNKKSIDIHSLILIRSFKSRGKWREYCRISFKKRF